MYNNYSNSNPFSSPGFYPSYSSRGSERHGLSQQQYDYVQQNMPQQAIERLEQPNLISQCVYDRNLQELIQRETVGRIGQDGPARDFNNSIVHQQTPNNYYNTPPLNPGIINPNPRYRPGS